MNDYKKTSAIALLPFLVFIIVFLGSGIALGDFYAFPAPVAALCGVLVAFLLPQSTFKKKIEYFLMGCGDKNILTMGVIYLLAGAFATVSKSIGSVEAIVNLGIKYLSAEYILVGVFLIASFLSTSSGTSVGTIVSLSPIAFGLANSFGIDVNMIGAALLCGAMFGDNLSFISDTTIAATQTMGCEMKDKFKENIKIAFPAFLLSAIVFIYLGSNTNTISANYQEIGETSMILIFPYLLVILLAMLGVNVFSVLIFGILSSGLVGIFESSLSWLDFSKKIYDGFLGMNDVFVLAIFTGGISGIVEKLGGIDLLLSKIKTFAKGQKSAYLGIASLVSLSDAAIANNTIAIILTGKVAKKISDDHKLNPKLSASILDIFSCIVQGLIPYGAQILVLMELSGNQVDYFEMIKNTWYIYFLLVFAIISIVFQGNKKRN